MYNEKELLLHIRTLSNAMREAVEVLNEYPSNPGIAAQLQTALDEVWEKVGDERVNPSDFIPFWDVMVDGDCIAHFRHEEKAIAFMMCYGDDTWLCLERTVYFCDAIDPRQVYDSVTVEVEGKWRSYTDCGPRYSEQHRALAADADGIADMLRAMGDGDREGGA